MKLIFKCAFQIYVNIIGLPVYMEITKIKSEQFSKFREQDKLHTIKYKLINQ